MFANNNLCVMNFSFPDVCNLPTPVGPVPLPLVNIAMSATHVPSVFNILMGPGLAENLLTMGTVSNGDQVGVAMGVASGMIIGPDRYMLGSFKCFIGCAPAARLTSLTGQNGMMPNMVGLSITPGQVSVLLLG